MSPLLLLATLSELPPHIQFHVSDVSVLVAGYLLVCYCSHLWQPSKEVSQGHVGIVALSCDRNDDNAEIFGILRKEKRKIIQEITRARHDPL